MTAPHEVVGNLVFGSPPSKADYQPTQWGMSPEERARLEQQAADIRAKIESVSSKASDSPAGRVYRAVAKELERRLADIERRLEQQGADAGFGQALRAAAMGEGGPSVAEQVLQRGIRASGQQAMGMARGMRGVAPGLAAKMALRSQAGLAQEGASQAGMLRAQEMMGARGQYAQHQAQQQAAWALIQQLHTQQAIANAGQPGSPGLVGYGIQGLAAAAPLLAGGATGGAVGGYSPASRPTQPAASPGTTPGNPWG